MTFNPVAVATANIINGNDSLFQNASGYNGYFCNFFIFKDSRLGVSVFWEGPMDF